MVAAKSGPLEVVLPTVPHLVARLSELTSRWPIRPRIVLDEAEKHAAFRRARAALAASGTVTLELALAGVPSVAAYRVPVLEELMLRMMVRIHPVIKVRSVILANLVLGEFAIPEFLQKRVTAENLAAALSDILGDTPGRRRQIDERRRFRKDKSMTTVTSPDPAVMSERAPAVSDRANALAKRRRVHQRTGTASRDPFAGTLGLPLRHGPEATA